MLFDTLDGAFMNFAYGWAFARPVRKVYYNLVITGLSIGAAFIIGTVEILGVLTSELAPARGAFWDHHGQLQRINTAGFLHRGPVRPDLGACRRLLAPGQGRGPLDGQRPPPPGAGRPSRTPHPTRPTRPGCRPLGKIVGQNVRYHGSNDPR